MSQEVNITMNQTGNVDENNTEDGEGVWSPDIEQCFQEALLLYPPCGRRKHIVPNDGAGKMYGRNELIAKYILMRTGKKRTRKQVSSHIQVLARRKAKTDVPSNGCGFVESSSSTTNSTGSPSSSTNLMLTQTTSFYDVWVDREIVTQKIRLLEFSAFQEVISTSPNLLHHPQQHLQTHHHPQQHHQAHHHPQQHHQAHHHCYIQIDYRSQTNRNQQLPQQLELIDINQIHDKFPDLTGPNGLLQRGPSDAFFLIKFWADLNSEFKLSPDIKHELGSNTILEDPNSFYGFSSQFETKSQYKDIICSTKACSYGLKIVEKVERLQAQYNSSNGRYYYSTKKSPMCTFMQQFIKKLHHLPKHQLMNSVLENFTVLQVISSESTGETLLCLAFVFEIASTKENGPQYHIYRLT